MTGRAAYVAGLRALADHLETHPDLPVPSAATSQLGPYIDGTDEAKRAEVDRIAAVLGVPAVDHGDAYEARRVFGPVTYEATAITAERMARWGALMSYRSAVQPERSTP